MGLDEGFDLGLIKGAVPEHGVVSEAVGGVVIGRDAGVGLGGRVVAPGDTWGERREVGGVGRVVGNAALGAFLGAGGDGSESEEKGKRLFHGGGEPPVRVWVRVHQLSMCMKGLHGFPARIRTAASIAFG